MRGRLTSLMAQIEEPLLESAPLAWRLAPQLCRKDPATGENCAWVHRFWQYLRLLGLASTPSLHMKFFTDALTDRAGDQETPKVLISGAADYSMLALVLHAYRERNIRPDVTVVDQCETPLMLNRWFAERVASEITTRRCDIFEYTDAGSFDAVCTHSFLSELPPGRWPALLCKWRQLLRPGGAAITINRLRPGVGSAPVGFTPEQASAFRAAVLERARLLPGASRTDPLELAHAAETYMSQRRTYAVQSREQILTLFEGAGFRVDSLSHGPVVSGVRHEVSGPTTPGSADYARIVASRL